MKEGDGPIPQGWQGEPRFAIFFIPAPVPLALPQGSTLSLQRSEKVDWLIGMPVTPELGVPPMPAELSDGSNFVSVKVWRVKEELKLSSDAMRQTMIVVNAVVPGGHMDEKSLARGPTSSISEVESYATVLEAVTPLLPITGEDGEIDLQLTVDAAFDKCIEQINEIVRAYIVTTKDVRVEPISRFCLFPIVPWTTKSIDGEQWGRLALYMPHHYLHKFPTPTGTMEDSKAEDFFTIISRMRQGDPFMPFSEHARACYRALEMRGDFEMVVIHAHVATETLFNSMLLMMAWEEGLDPQTAAEWFDEGLSKRLRTHYAARLGGSWDTTNPRTSIGKWAKDLRDTRDRVMHTGQHPNEIEAMHAVWAMNETEEFLKKRLSQNRLRYPRTTLMLLGVPGLRRLGAYVGKIVRFVERVAPVEGDWMESYSRWVDVFKTERVRITQRRIPQAPAEPGSRQTD